jgi:hypothetical protein
MVEIHNLEAQLLIMCITLKHQHLKNNADMEIFITFSAFKSKVAKKT